jgi:hypothetical protein
VQLNKGTTEEDDNENFSDAQEAPKQTKSSRIKQTSVGSPATTNKV